MSLDRVLKDPRLVTMDHNGEKIHFWHHRRMYDMARNHGYDPETVTESESAFALVEDIMRYLWMCHLAFEPDLSFEEFDMMFLPSDYGKLGRIAGEIQVKQLPKPGADEAEPAKKETGRSKTKKTPSSSAR